VTNEKRFDLEDRTLAFAREVRSFLKRIPRNLGNSEDGVQLLGASGSVGANYIEANESLSKRDFLVRIKICRKKAKECGYWLRLIDAGREAALIRDKESLIRESTELTSIFGAILRKSEQRTTGLADESDALRRGTRPASWEFWILNFGF
jgi:four helix bundle protein